MDPKCWGLSGCPHLVSQNEAWEASVRVMWLCEHGCLLEHKEAKPGSEQGGEAGSSPSRKGQEEPCPSQVSQAGQPRGSFPPFSSSFSRVNFPKPALPVSHRNRACMCVHFIISEESICSRLVSHQEALSICQQPAPLHYKRKDKSSRCISWHPPPQTTQIN